MHVTFNLLLPRSPRSSSTSLALHYDAFDPSYWGVMCLSLHMPKPSQPGSPASLRIEVQTLTSP